MNASCRSVFSAMCAQVVLYRDIRVCMCIGLLQTSGRERKTKGSEQVYDDYDSAPPIVHALRVLYASYIQMQPWKPVLFLFMFLQFDGSETLMGLLRRAERAKFLQTSNLYHSYTRLTHCYSRVFSSPQLCFLSSQENILHLYYYILLKNK